MPFRAMPQPHDAQPAAAFDRLLRVEHHLHRFDRSQTLVMVVRTYETDSGKRYRRIAHEPWEGL